MVYRGGVAKGIAAGFDRRAQYDKYKSRKVIYIKEHGIWHRNLHTSGSKHQNVARIIAFRGKLLYIRRLKNSSRYSE